MAEIFNFDIVAANNNSAPPNGWPENMEYDEVNNTARELYAVIARFIKGSLSGTNTTAGTQPAYTLVSGFTLGAYAAGQIFAFLAHADSTAAVTLNVDGLGAGAVSDARGIQLGSGDIRQNGVYLVVRTASAFRVVGQLSSTSIQALALNTLGTAYLAGGTANAITVTTGLFTAYADGQLIAFRASNSNSGACTINIDGLGAEALNDATNQALATGDIINPRIYLCGRTGSTWRVLTSLPVDLATQVSGLLPNANLANMADSTIKGRAVGAGSGAPTDLTATQATAILNNFTSALKGLVPLSGGGTVNFLRADATWVPVGLQLIEEGALSAVASKEFTSLSTYDELVLVLLNMIPATDNVNLELHVRQGGSYLEAASSYQYSASRQAGATSGGTNSSGDTSIDIIAAAGNNTAERVSATIFAYRHSVAAFVKQFHWQGGGRLQDASVNRIQGFGEVIANTDAYDGIRIRFSSGNITSGYFALFGRNW